MANAGEGPGAFGDRDRLRRLRQPFYGMTPEHYLPRSRLRRPAGKTCRGGYFCGTVNLDYGSLFCAALRYRGPDQRHDSSDRNNSGGVQLAKLTFSKPYHNWTPSLFGRFNPEDVVTASASTFKLVFADDYSDPPELQGWSVTYKSASSSFEYSLGAGNVNEAVAGEVTSVEFRKPNGNLVAKLTDLDNVDIADIYPYIVNSGVDGPSADGRMVAEYLLGGDDVITGTNGDEDFVMNEDFGDDRYVGKGGNDHFEIGAGNDTVEGGDGFDHLSYNSSHWAASARHGIVVDIAGGTVIDAYGDTDIFSGIERFTGSRFADTFTGTPDDPLLYHEVMGNRGADTFDFEVASNTWLAYREDRFNGGQRGIKADLGSVNNGDGDVKGTIKDGFGHTDKTVNVRYVEGTQFDDSFKGSRLNDHFNPGEGGVDSYDGGAGTDWMQFDTTDRGGGAINVDLSRGSGQIIDDGYGNTETVVSVEGIGGSIFDDTIKGNSKANELHGGEGNDTLTGGGGKDKFIFGNYQGNNFGDNGDVITDFTRGKDKLVFDLAWLADHEKGISLDSTLRIVMGDHATAKAGNSQFYFNADDHTLHLDFNGKADGSDMIVAVLEGVNKLDKNDFQFVTNYIDLV